jgi:hypothetical protein
MSAGRKKKVLSGKAAGTRKPAKGRAADSRAKTKPKKVTAASRLAGKVKQAVLPDALRTRAEDAGRERANTEFEEALGTGADPKAVPELTAFIVREWVRQIAGDGRAKDSDRKQMEPIYKDAFEAQWRSLAR